MKTAQWYVIYDRSMGYAISVNEIYIIIPFYKMINEASKCLISSLEYNTVKQAKIILDPCSAKTILMSSNFVSSTRLCLFNF